VTSGESECYASREKRSRDAGSSREEGRISKKRAKTEESDQSLERILGQYLKVTTDLLIRGKSSQSPPTSQEDELSRRQRVKAEQELDLLKERLTKAWESVEKCQHLPIEHPHRRAMTRDYNMKFLGFERKARELYGREYDEADCNIDSVFHDD
tara:strand:+ start:755 stop:1216 length:462 start_codon:yes stop_codon:yes gene_type:complete